jgi:hypothetical protein
MRSQIFCLNNRLRVWVYISWNFVNVYTYDFNSVTLFVGKSTKSTEIYCKGIFFFEIIDTK